MPPRAPTAPARPAAPAAIEGGAPGRSVAHSGAAAAPVVGPGPTGVAAAALLADLGIAAERVGGMPDPRGKLHPDLDWARCGAMALTGPADGAPRLPPAALTRAARAAFEAWKAVVRTDTVGAEVERRLDAIDAPALLGERAACFGFARHGPISPGGSCRMLRARDGWLALNLARPDDVELLPAWLECDAPAADPWRLVAESTRGRARGPLVARGRSLGLPVAAVGEAATATRSWCLTLRCGSPAVGATSTTPIVIDLSGLWAGPLCGQLLALAGARVIKVESSARPDGARRGNARFFDLLNAEKESVALDFTNTSDRKRLRGLIGCADIVVESARPRAMRQLGIDAAEWVAARQGRTWLSITGYGRSDPHGDFVAFGDDAAAAAGLVVAPERGDAPPLFCGDAIADPLTGLHAVLAATASHRAGGGQVLDVSLCDVGRRALQCGLAREEPRGRVRVTDAAPRGVVDADGESAAIGAPVARSPGGRAPPLGADTERVLRELAAAC